MNNRQVLLVPQWLQWRKRRMKPEKAIQVDHWLPGNVDTGSQRVILPLGMWNYDIEPIRRPALKNHDHALVTEIRLRRSECRPCQERRNCSGSDHCHRPAF